MDHATLAVNAAAATTITVFGVATGLDHAVLLGGFLGGIVSLSFLPKMSIPKTFFSLVGSTLVAGYIGPIAVQVAEQRLGIDLHFLPSGGYPHIGFLMGAMAQTGIPVAFGWLKNKFGVKGPSV